MNPTLSQIAFCLISIMPCNCFVHLPPLSVNAATQHALGTPGVVCDCELVTTLLDYQLNSGGAFPTSSSELQVFVTNRNRMEADPDDYCQNMRFNISTPNVEFLEPHVAQKADACSICANDIATGQNVIELPQCKHTFHADASECLGESTIINWLEQSRHCPNCNAEVVVPEQVAPGQN